MSYSRWIDSRWYTYYDANSGVAKDEQIFTICYVTQFTYKDLKEDIDKCLQKIKEQECEVKDYELTELKSYMQQFMNDVESGLYMDKEV